jgi:hypothetical protein
VLGGVRDPVLPVKDGRDLRYDLDRDDRLQLRPLDILKDGPAGLPILFVGRERVEPDVGVDIDG